MKVCFVMKKKVVLVGSSTLVNSVEKIFNFLKLKALLMEVESVLACSFCCVHSNYCNLSPD